MLRPLELGLACRHLRCSSLHMCARTAAHNPHPRLLLQYARTVKQREAPLHLSLSRVACTLLRCPNTAAFITEANRKALLLFCCEEAAGRQIAAGGAETVDLQASGPSVRCALPLLHENAGAAGAAGAGPKGEPPLAAKERESFSCARLGCSDLAHEEQGRVPPTASQDFLSIPPHRVLPMLLRLATEQRTWAFQEPPNRVQFSFLARALPAIFVQHALEDTGWVLQVRLLQGPGRVRPLLPSFHAMRTPLAEAAPAPAVRSADPRLRCAVLRCAALQATLKQQAELAFELAAQHACNIPSGVRLGSREKDLATFMQLHRTVPVLADGLPAAMIEDSTVPLLLAMLRRLGQVRTSRVMGPGLLALPCSSLQPTGTRRLCEAQPAFRLFHCRRVHCLPPGSLQPTLPLG